MNNQGFDYFVALFSILAGSLMVLVAQKLIIRRLKAWAQMTETSVDDFLIQVIESTLVPLLYFGVLYFGIRSLALPPFGRKAMSFLGIVLLTFYGVRFLTQTVSYTVMDLWVKKQRNESLEKGMRGLLPVVRILIWGVGIIFLLDNLGVKVSTVITGLGISGIAVALAAQAVLGDLFSYIAILFDRPFSIGDFVVVDEFMGTIEHIGIKTTRIRSLNGELLVFSNTNLTGSRIRNYKMMEKRRVTFTLGVTYETAHGQLKEIPGLIQSVVKRVSGTLFDRAHFASYGDFSLNFEVVYYVLSGDYNRYMDIHQEINLAIKEEFDKRGIGFAYPTQTLYLNRLSAPNA
ncbi:MAG: mechanosensitive ion channel family protein [Elusimicrobia bacterium]|nr:mechanosensitive ion channel family protein [Elusimicrobiota bacterium]